MQAQIFNFPVLKSGTVFEGIRFQLPEEEVYNLTGGTAKIQLRKSPGGLIEQEFKLSDGSLIIETPYDIVLPEQNIRAKPGVFFWDLKIRFADGRVEIPFAGKWTIETYITQL
jgi:hypothetical protein